MTDQTAAVYILANKPQGTLYIGATADLPRRVWEHRQGTTPGFAQRHGCRLLVWYEVCADFDQALRREKQLKKWKRAWKFRLIEEANPIWRDRSEELE